MPLPKIPNTPAEPVIGPNNNANPMGNPGGLTTPIPTQYYQTFTPSKVINPLSSNQIAGLVPVFSCSPPECRLGKYNADATSNDNEFTIPVFAELNPTAPVDYYKNDYNSFLFDATAGTYLFYLDKVIAGNWVEVATLNNGTYGTLSQIIVTGCTPLNWQGFEIEWYKVLTLLGAGTYRFRVGVTVLTVDDFTKCWWSPPFCLAEWDCYAVDWTTKFETQYTGGKIGNVDKKNCGGASWSFCMKFCFDEEIIAIPLFWRDSIRVGGFFGYENTDYERKNIKYQTGIVNKIRDEALLKFSWQSTSLPFWFHERFKAYGLMADILVVSDYNLNNADYNIKRYCVRGDSSYNPGYKGSTRYTKVRTDFRPRTEYIIRSRCC